MFVLVVLVLGIHGTAFAESSQGGAVDPLINMLNAKNASSAHSTGVTPKVGGGYQVGDVGPGQGVPRDKCATTRYDSSSYGSGYGAGSGYSRY
jgi:hypothetical protein